ncbi:MAG: 6-bladed beta-propeller [Bacteroidales bacterium]
MKIGKPRIARSFITASATAVLIFILPAAINDPAVAYIKKTGGQEIVVCPVEKVTETRILPLSEIVESCEMIRLEQGSNYIVNPWFSVISAKHILIVSRGAVPVKLFDRATGKYVCDIGATGRGPNEYARLYGAQFSNDGKTIYLFPSSGPGKIMAFNTAGEFLRDIPLASDAYLYKAWFTDENEITVVTLPGGTVQTICFRQDYSGKMISTLPSLTHLKKGEEIFTNYTPGKISFYITGSDTLYEYNKKVNSLSPKFALEFSEKRLLNTCRELPGYYYASLRGEDTRWRTLMVNKNTLKAFYTSMVNDFYGGIESAMFFSNDYYLETVPAFTLKGRIKKVLEDKNLPPETRKRLTDMDNSLTEDDNDIVFYGKLKQ